MGEAGEEEEDDEDEDAHGESTPFLSMQNMSMEPPPPPFAAAPSSFRSSAAPDMRTQRGLSRPGTRSNGQSRSSQSHRSKAEHMPL